MQIRFRGKIISGPFMAPVSVGDEFVSLGLYDTAMPSSPDAAMEYNLRVSIPADLLPVRRPITVPGRRQKLKRINDVQQWCWRVGRRSLRFKSVSVARFELKGEHLSAVLRFSVAPGSDVLEFELDEDVTVDRVVGPQIGNVESLAASARRAKGLGRILFLRHLARVGGAPALRGLRELKADPAFTVAERRVIADYIRAVKAGRPLPELE